MNRPWPPRATVPCLTALLLGACFDFAARLPPPASDRGTIDAARDAAVDAGDVGIGFGEAGSIDASGRIEGTYTVHARHTNHCLGGTADGPRAHRCEAGWGSQRWQLHWVDSTEPIYQLRQEDGGRCLSSRADEGGALALQACDASSQAQHWLVEPRDSAQRQIRNRATQVCLGSNATIQQGALTKETCAATHWSQHWELLPASSAELSWSPYIDSRCWVHNATEAEGWFRAPVALHADCGGSAKPAWVMWASSETVVPPVDFGPLTPQQIGPGKLWNFNLPPNKVSMSLDKVTIDAQRDRFTYVGFTDSFDLNGSAPNLGQQLFADFQLEVKEAARLQDAKTGLGKGRVLLGIAAQWDNTTRFLEVVFWDHPEYDGCPATGPATWWGDHPADPCDPGPGNLYERRSTWPGGETVYYYASALEQLLGYAIPALTPGGGQQSYRIPVTTLFQSYAWHWGKPSDWSKARVAGVYIGIEIWGKARVWAELGSYHLYAVGE